MTRKVGSQATQAQPWPQRLLRPKTIGVGLMVLVAVAAAVSTKVVHVEDAVIDEVFSAEEFAAEHFDDIIEPQIRENAVDLVTLLAAIEDDEQNAKDTYGNSSNPFNAYSYPVVVTGIAGVPTESEIPLSVDGVAADVAVSVQISQFRGTALRDVTGTVDLNSFLNQVEYLNVSLKLNEAARANVIDPFFAQNPPATLEGKTLVIIGAFLKDSATTIAIVPISIEVQS